MTDLVDKLAQLARAHGVSLIDALETCPMHHGENGAVLLEDLVDHIEHMGRMKDPLYRAAVVEVEQLLS